MLTISFVSPSFNLLWTDKDCNHVETSELNSMEDHVTKTKECATDDNIRCGFGFSTKTKVEFCFALTRRRRFFHCWMGTWVRPFL